MKSIVFAVLVATFGGCAIVPIGPPLFIVGGHGDYDHGYGRGGYDRGGYDRGGYYGRGGR